MHRKISLTMRLTGLHTLISTSILLGLGWLIFTSIEQHFIEMDREILQNKISLTKEIINKKSSQEDLQKRLDEVFKKQNGLFVNIENKNGSIIYATADFPHPETPIEEKSTNTT